MARTAEVLSFGMEAMGAQLTFRQFRLSARLGADGTPVETPRLLVSSVCADISLYGAFLPFLGLCNPQTDLLLVFGASLLRPRGVAQAPAGVGTIDFAVAGGKVTATAVGSTLRPAEHAIGLLLVDDSTGKPVSIDYGRATTRSVAGDGTLESVSLDLGGAAAGRTVRAYLMVDTYPAVRGTVVVP